MIDPTIVTAVPLETRAVRRALPGARVVEVGVGLSRLRSPLVGPIVTCGLAGALRADLDTGAVVVPDRVRGPDGTERPCDAELVARLAAGARRLGLEPVAGTLLTSATLVVGAERRRWAERGCVAADMETGLLAADRLAAVRVVLDTPERELSGAWQRPWRALLHPGAWRELPWLARESPRCARLAAAVLAAALRPDAA